MSSGGKAPDTSGQNYAAKLNADIAKNMWDEYKETYAPMERQFAANAGNYDTAGRRAQEAGKAQGDVTTQFAQARDRLGRTAGLDPSSPQYLANLQQLDLAQAASGASAQNKARNYIEEMGYARKQDAISIGKGMPGTASGAISASGQMYGQVANQNMQQQQMKSNNIAGAVGGGIAVADMISNWRDGGHVRQRPVQRLAMGGMVGNPRMMQLLANSQASANADTPAGAPDTRVQDAIKTGRQAHKVYGMLNPAAAVGTGATGVTAGAGAAGALGTGVAAAGAGGGVGATGVTAGLGAAGSLGTGTAAAGLAGGVGATGITAGSAGAAALGGSFAGAGAAGAGAAAAGAGAAAAGAAGAGASAAGGALAAAGPVGWALGAGLLLSSLFKDGGHVKSSENNILGRANGINGGKVSGPGGPREDLVPAMLSDGEFVINAKAVDKVGVKKLTDMNNLGLPKQKRSKS